MGRSVSVVAIDGCTAQINDLFTRAFPDAEPLLWDEATIRKQLRVIRRDPKRVHLRYIKTVSDWNESLRAWAVGCGNIVIDSQLEARELEATKAKILWVISNRMLFASIKGIDDADILGIDCGQHVTGFKNGRPVADLPLNFEELPVEPQCAAYLLAKAWGRPDIWQRFVAFRAKPDIESWSDLRTANIAGGTRCWSIWQRVEMMEFEITGKDYGLMGRYNRIAPSLALVEAALGLSEPSMDRLWKRQRAAP